MKLLYLVRKMRKIRLFFSIHTHERRAHFDRSKEHAKRILLSEDYRIQKPLGREGGNLVGSLPVTLDLLCEKREDCQRIANKAHIGCTKDRCIGILVDGDDVVGFLHASQVLDSA